MKTNFMLKAGARLLCAYALLAAPRSSLAQGGAAVTREKVSTLQLLEAAHTLFVQGDFENARKHYLQVLASYPDNFDLLNNLAYCYYSLGPRGMAQAAHFYAAAYKINPNSHETAENLAKCLPALGRHAEAAAIFRKFAESPDAKPEAWKRLAEAYDAARMIPQAESAYDTYLQRNPGDLDARSNLGRLYSWEKEYAKAMEQFRIALAANPNFSPALIGEARILSWQGKHAEGFELYERVLRLNPGNGEAESGKAFVLLWMGRPEEAETLFTSLHRRYPRDGEVARGLETARAAQEEKVLAAARRAGSTTQAEAYYRQRLEKNPKDAGAVEALAHYTSEPRRCSESIAYSRKALELSPENSSLELVLARSLAICQQNAEAVARFRRYLESNPQAEDASFELGRTLMRSRRTTEAVEVFRNLLRLNPQNSDGQQGLALALAASGNYTEALARYDEILKKSPENYDALQGKAYILYWNRQFAQARAIFQSLAAMRPGDGQNAEALESIARSEEDARWAALRPAAGAPPKDFLAYYEKRLASYPDDRAGMKALAETEERLDNIQAAVDAYRRTLAKYPDDTDAKSALERLLGSRVDRELVSRARTLAYEGGKSRAEALAMLKDYLARASDDDARTLYGTVLSWEGRYDEARGQLSQVIANHPYHADALAALIDLELWSHHPDRAEQLSRGALARDPNNETYLQDHANALVDLHHDEAAIKELERLVAVDPNNRSATERIKRMRRVSGRYWEVKLNHTYDFFSDGRPAQHETSLSLRLPTRVGSLTTRVNRADRFGLTSYQEEIDVYPSFRPGTYAYVNVGYSFDADLYPRYRGGADLFQSLGHGYEVSGGLRLLHFTGNTNIYTFALGKYRGSWLFTGRAFLTPGNTGTSQTAVLSARRFFSYEGLHDYLEVACSAGASPALARTTLNIETLDSYRCGIDLDHTMGNWAVEFKAGMSQEQRTSGAALKRYEIQGFINYRF